MIWKKGLIWRLPSPWASLFRTDKAFRVTWDYRRVVQANVRPRQKCQKSSKGRQKWDSSMAMVNNTSVSHFKVKNTLLKHTDGKGNFKRMLRFFSSWQRKAFSYKIVLRGIQNTRNFHHSRSERLACFETPPSSEVFEEFSGTFCTLWSRKWRICEYFILDIWDRLEQPIWDLCWIIFA